MRNRFRRLIGCAVCAGAALIGSAVGAAAGPITFVPTTASNSLLPFGDVHYFGEYQQVYLADGFPRPYVIRSVAFTMSPEFVGVPGWPSRVDSSFTLGVGTTSVGPASMSSQYAENRGPDFTRVFDGTVTGAAAVPFSFRIAFDTPFLYDPSRGNLLLDVFIERNTMNGAFFPFMAGNDSRMGIVYTAFFNFSPIGSAKDPYAGLLTRFDDAVPTPEPATLLLIGGGCAVAFGKRRRR